GRWFSSRAPVVLLQAGRTLGGELLFQLVSCDEQGVPNRAPRRNVSQVELFDLCRGEADVQRNGNGVDALAGAGRTREFCPQQPARLEVRAEPQNQTLCIGEVGGPVGSFDGDRNGLVAGSAGGVGSQ